MSRAETGPHLRRARIAATVVAALAVVPPLAASPQADASAAGSESHQLARIVERLDLIARLLADRAGTERLAIAMQRLELAERRVGQAEAALESARSERESLLDVRARQRRDFEVSETQLTERAARSPLDRETQLDAERFVEEMRAETARVDERLRSLDLRIVDLENQLARRRDEVERWNDVVARGLAGPGPWSPSPPQPPPDGGE